MKDLVEYIAKSLVNAPDDVVVTEEEAEEGIVLKLQVADEDKGRIIGKQGRIAQAIRTLIRVKAAKAGTRARDDAPSGHWCTTTMISSVRLDGSTACMVVVC